MTRQSLILVAIGALSFAGNVRSSEADSADHGAIAKSSLKEENYRGIRYVTGGIGEREQAEITALAPNYAVMIVLYNDRGAYLSGVELAFRDEKGGTVLLATSRGPYFLVDLPKGRYALEARQPSSPVQHHSLTVSGDKTQTLRLKLPVKGR